MKSIYNEETGALHYEGSNCPNARITLVKCKLFDTEQQAYKYAGKHIKPCKLCEKYKEKKMRG